MSSERGDDVYQPDDSSEEAPADSGVLDPEDTLNDREADPYDEGWSPPEKPRGVEHTGTTAQEQREGETLDERLAEEVPDPSLEVPDDPADDGLGDLPGGDGELVDDEVGDARAGRLVALDEGAHEDTEKDLLASDVGVDGAAASAEEAAMHVVPDDE
ncbi:DUF5709 domain-containing protein [Streptomyces sp. NPDC091272]|uniref:DUF5709 domain-containing protein n=1 Tax=Streptomyces sp. NPDC091272 TaxID=3365981 RepID=UPI003829B9BC